MRSASVLLIALGALGSCQQSSPPPPAAAQSSVPAVASVAPPVPSRPAKGCPKGMASIPGAPFKVGNFSVNAAPEESPGFETKVATFCMDLSEVTVSDYSACTISGKCSAAHDDRRFCNVRYSDRGNHPVNCVDWHQAADYCAFRGARLPSEVEFEYAARGGTEYRAYSWGNEPPDGRTCWKHVGGSCPVKQYPAGAFGLYDVIGNVWEWTDDWFGDYPWPPETGLTKVYRGGSWSRRFEKWMSPRLRNRYAPKQWGSHLGFRCALTPQYMQCPYGRSEDGTRCRFGVETAQCSGREKWNGVRCALPGEPKCPAGRVENPGHGCALEQAASGPAPEVETTPVTRTRSPEFDADCLQNKPGRPHAYKYVGGTHYARNRVSGAAGCANRDVGVGWNSTCCP
jgi:formylglycine-generating enzyme required for sulfatase activity